MLYLNPPYYIINGVSLFPDDADLLQWYYAPLVPQTSTVPDPGTGNPVPSVQLLMFRGAAGNGGFLNLDVNIGVPQNQLDQIKGTLMGQAGLTEMPRLAPIPTVDGTVHLLLLGQQSAAPPTQPPPAGPAGGHPPAGTAGPGPGAPGEPQFVLKMDQAAKPSLYGDNQATFAVELDQDGAALMAQALQGAFTPIGVVYSLDFVALRPAYTVSLTVHWDRVQQHLDEQFGFSTFIYSSEIDKAVDNLIESRDIDLQVTTFVPEGPDAGSVITDKDKAVAEVREMITSAFFTPSVDPVHDDGTGVALATANRISQLLVTGGMSSTATFSYKHVDYTRIDKKALDVTMNERTAVLRTIWPQGHLAGITALVRQSGLPMDKFIIQADLDNAFFAHRRIAVNPIGISPDAQLLSVDIQFNYGGDITSLAIDPTQPKQGQVAWTSKLDASGQMIKPVSYQYTVDFADTPGLTRPKTLTTPTMTALSDSVDVFPPHDVPYTVLIIPITTVVGFPWDRWIGVDVDLRYHDDAQGIVQVDQRSLTKASPTPTPWQMFIRDDTQRTFQARLTYRGGPDRPDHIADWVDVTDEKLLVDDPFGGRVRKVMVVPVFIWTTVARVFVDLSYADPANSIGYQQSLQFDASHQDPQLFVVGLANPALRRVDYSVTIIYADGHQVTVPPSATLADRLILTAEMRGNRIVSVTSDGGDFSAKGVKTITVQLSYSDNQAGISIAQTVTLAAPTDQGSFEFPFVDPGRLTFTYSVTYDYTSGLSQALDPVSTADDSVVIPVR